MKYQPGGIVAKIPMPMVSTKKPPKNQAILFMMFSRQSFVIKQAQTINRAHTGAAVYSRPCLSRKVEENFAPLPAYITGAVKVKKYGSDARQHKVFRHNAALVFGDYRLAQADDRLIKLKPRPRAPTGVHRKARCSLDR